MPPPHPPILVAGAGDVGSAVAWFLFIEGHAAVLLDRERPLVTRRRMAFADAAWDGAAVLAVLRAREDGRPVGGRAHVLPGPPGTAIPDAKIASGWNA